MKTNLFILLIGVLLVSCQTDEEKAEEAFGKCEAELNAGDTAAALVYLKEAIELDPENVKYHLSKAMCQYEIGEYENAIVGFSDVIDLPFDITVGYSTSTIWNYLGLSYSHIGEPKNAIDAYTEAIELKPNEYVYWFNRALDREVIGDYEGAMNDFTEAIELNPKYSRSWNERGMVHYELNNYSSAIYDFSKAIELKPTSANYFSNRAYVKRLNGDQEGACADARVAEQLGKDMNISKYCD